MQYRTEVISYLQSNKILSLKLDHAVSEVSEQVVKQIKTLGAGSQRILFYASCFTEEYLDVCQQQKSEDIRFLLGITKLIENNNIIFDMLKLYFDEVFRFKNYEQLENINKYLMALNVRISVSTLTGAGLALSVATVVALSINMRLEMSALAGRRVGAIAGLVSIYGIVQKAADCAHYLQLRFPNYYAALYTRELEMMYFLIEPIFVRSGAYRGENVSEYELARIINRMINNHD
ncbi:hypothetical protein [Pantoea sp. SM3]|uniref:hypothetical protein n=1 Tax=Pantoea sp. SM3 TaxID=1628192 RepID=UPI0005F82780|nr:hypothetical protein [Pantoea sp. SM3]KJV28777.1 hypothetical protein VI01_16800 [Pantoea sp. SM3]